MADEKQLDAYGLSPAPETAPHYGRQRLHEYGITGAEESDWLSGFGSSNVDAFRWVAGDPYPLQVRFKGGVVYGYAVAESVYEGLLFAPSKGKAINELLKRPRVPYLKLG